MKYVHDKFLVLDCIRIEIQSKYISYAQIVLVLVTALVKRGRKVPREAVVSAAELRYWRGSRRFSRLRRL